MASDVAGQLHGPKAWSCEAVQVPKYVAPEVGLWEMTCPLCGTLVSQRWRKVFVDSNRTDDPPDLVEQVRFNKCGACEATSWWIDGAMVSPRVGVDLPPHDDTPPDVKALYNEARSIADLSPRSAAALLRTALETLTREHLGQAGRLNDAIGNLVASGALDPMLQQSMDILRVSGNGAVHPGEIQEGDTAAEATALFELLNLVTESLIARPQRIQAMFDKLPEAKRDQIAKRDGAETS